MLLVNGNKTMGMASAAAGAAQPPVQRQQRAFLHASEHATLDPRNVLALHTLFAIAHSLALLLGESWLLVLGTVNCLDRILSTPRQAAQVLQHYQQITAAATDSRSTNALLGLCLVDTAALSISLDSTVPVVPTGVALHCYRARTRLVGTTCRSTTAS